MNRGELRAALRARRRADARDPGAGARDDGGVQRAEPRSHRTPSVPARPGVRAVRPRDGLPGRADVEMTGPSCASAPSRPRRVPPESRRPRWRSGSTAHRSRAAGRVRHDVRAVLHHRVGIGGNEAQTDALTHCFLEHGGTVLTNSTVESIAIERGRATGVVLFRALHPGARVDARIAVLSNAGVPETLRLVGEPSLAAADARLAAKMRHWKMGLRGSHVTSWLLDRRLSWGSAPHDPLVDDADLYIRDHRHTQGRDADARQPRRQP